MSKILHPSTFNEPLIIRNIEPKDNAQMAQIIRRSLEEFGAAKEGTVYFDATTDHLFELFQKEKSHYFVAEIQGVVAGGAGIFPTMGLHDDTCELVKMYVSSSNRKGGIGTRLLGRCSDAARTLGYRKMYIETMPELKFAIEMYRKSGFEYIPGPLGDSGHSGCSIFMLKDL